MEDTYSTSDSRGPFLQIFLLEVKKFPRKLRNFIEMVKFWQKKSVFALSKTFFKKGHESR